MKKMTSFRKALENLETIRGKKPPYDAVTTAGMVSLFGICFESAWKVMKEQLELSGYTSLKLGSPRSVLKMAYQAHMIDDEELWMEALHQRNDATHSYNEAVALGLIRDTQQRFIDMFERLEGMLEKDWIVGQDE